MYFYYAKPKFGMFHLGGKCICWISLYIEVAYHVFRSITTKMHCWETNSKRQLQISRYIFGDTLNYKTLILYEI